VHHGVHYRHEPSTSTIDLGDTALGVCGDGSIDLQIIAVGIEWHHAGNQLVEHHT
jgi:hypothetical protein